MGIIVFNMKFQLLNKFLFLFILLFFSESRAQESHLISFNNEIIHYKTFGNGRPLLIINGGPGMNCEGFENLAQEIANKGFKTIIYDQRGTGKSLLPIVDSTTITLKLMVEDIEKLRKQLKIDKWSLFGQSFGGVLVAKYAYQYPERVDKIIFSSSAGLDLKFMETINQRLINNLSKTEQDSLGYYSQKLDIEPKNQEVALKRAQFLASAYVVQKKYIPQLAKRMTQVDYDINELVFNDLIKNKYDLNSKFSTFKKPTLIFQGKNDVISIESAQSIKDNFPNSKLILLENCGHYPWLDQTNIFFNALFDFL